MNHWIGKHRISIVISSVILLMLVLAVLNAKALIGALFRASIEQNNGWLQPPSIVETNVEEGMRWQRLTDWRQLPIYRDADYWQQSSTQRVGKPYVFSFVSDEWLRQVFPLKWPENDDALNFICRGKNSRIKMSESFQPYYDREICEEDYIEGAVVAHVAGAGRLSRLWMTTASASMNALDEEVLKIYVDDNPIPKIQVALKDAFEGTADPIFAPPYGAGSPSFLAWYYPLSFNSKLIIAIDQLGPNDAYYHQTDVVLSKDTDGGGEQAVMAEDGQELSEGKGDLQFLYRMKNISIEPNSPYHLELAGPATIEAMTIEVAEADIEKLKTTHLSLHWEGDESPALDMPLGLLLSFKQDLYVRESGPISIRQTEHGLSFVFKLPMPYKQKLSVSLSNDQSLNLRFGLSGVESTPSKPWGHLHAQSSETLAPASSPFHPIADLNGRGRYLGTCAYLLGKKGSGFGTDLPFSFLEGDEFGWIDGELRIVGTGTEDYFNGSFYYSNSPFATRYAQYWGKVQESETQERVSQCRWHIDGDVIDFANSFRLQLEVGGRDPSAVQRYTTVAYYYQ